MQSKNHSQIFTAITIVLLFAMASQTNGFVVYDADCFELSPCTNECGNLCLSKGYHHDWYSGTFKDHVGCCCKKNDKLNRKIFSSQN